MKAFEPSEHDSQRLDSLILAFDEAVSGERSQDVADGTEEAGLPPGLAVKLDGAKAALRLLEQARLAGFSGEVDPDLEPLIAHEAMDREGGAIAVEGHRVGRFELVRELGRGGYGVVFLARDPQLGRQVALKVPRPEVLAGSEARRRFVREAQAAGSLAHPNLVPVYEVGEDGPFCYLATAYCDGPTLAEWLASHPGGVEPRLAARLIRDAARGIEHAHRRGVLHRDIKPSNILLESGTAAAGDPPADTSELCPRLTDFGLAKLLTRSDDETRSGVIVGTPAYMAPEQAAGRPADVDARADVYALGAVLYELVAGAPPYRGVTDVDTLRRLLLEEPRAPRQLVPNLPRDLEAIILKCLAKHPEGRYPTAQHLVEDLDRFLAGQPTLARPAGPLEQLAKWTRRRPTLAAASALLAAAAVALVAVIAVYNARLSNEVARADTQRDRAERESESVRRLLYTSDVRLASTLLEGKDVAQATQILSRQVPAPGETDLREFTWYHLSSSCQSPTLNLQGHEGDVFCVAWSPDGRRLATAGKDGTLRIWNSTTGQQLHVARGHTDEVTSVVYSTDGSRIYTGSEDGTIRCWHAQTAEPGPIWTGHTDHVMALAMSPRGDCLASGGRDCTVLLWNLQSGVVEHVWETQDVVRVLQFSPSGDWLCSGDESVQLRAWETATGKLAFVRSSVGEQHFAMAFHPDGECLVAAGRLEVLRFWRPSDQTLIKELESKHREWVQSLAFSPTGRTLASAGKDGVINLWDSSDYSHQISLLGHQGRIWSVAFAPDGRLASAGADNARIWNNAPAEGYPEIAGFVDAITYDPRGRELYACDSSGSLSIFDVASKQQIAKLAVEPSGSIDFRISPDGGHFVTLGETALKVWNRADFACRFTLPRAMMSYSPLAWMPRSHRVACGLAADRVAILDVETGKIEREYLIPSAARYLEFTADGSGLICLAEQCRVIDVRSGRVLHTMPESNWRAAWSADETFLALSDRSNVTLVDARSYQPLARLMTGAHEIRGMAISGPTLALSTQGPAAVNLWDLRTQQLLARLPTAYDGTSALAFSPDGSRLVVAGTSSGDTTTLLEWEIPSQPGQSE